MKIILYILVILLIPFKSFGIIGYDYGDTLTCLAVSGLKIRSEPRGNTVIGKVPLGGKVVVCAKPWGFSAELLPYKAEGIDGSWVKVKFNDLTGFVFDGFLSSLPAPTLQYHSLKDYAEGCFRQSGTKNTNVHNCEGLTLADTLEFFTHKGNYLVCEDRFGYESYSEILTIEGTSAEECYLIAMAIFKDDIDKVVAEMQAHPDKLGIVLQKEIDNKINDYKLFYFKDGKYELELMDDGCYDIISVVQLAANIFQIKRSSGC
jgi:hypothetical protein